MNRRELLKSIPAFGAALGMPGPAPAGEDKLARTARLRTALVAYSFRQALGAKTMTYPDLIRFAVEHDVDGLDLTVYWFPDTSDEFLLPLRRLAYRMGVDIYSISIRTDLCRPEGPLREKELAEVKRWSEAAQKLGAGHIRIFGGGVPKGATEQQAVSWAIETLRRGVEISGARGVILGLENHGGITERAETIVRIVRQVDSPWLGINLDTGNFRTDAMAQIKMCLLDAVNVQMKADIRADDGTRQAADWDRIVRMIAESGYKGYLGLEYEAKEDPATAVPRLVRQLRRLARQYSTAV